MQRNAPPPAPPHTPTDSGYDDDDTGRRGDDGSDFSIEVVLLGSKIVPRDEAIERLRRYRKRRVDNRSLIVRHNAQYDETQRALEGAANKEAYKPPTAVALGRLNQMQIYSSFLQVHFPSAKAKASLVSRNS